MKRIKISFILFLVGVGLFFLFPFTNDFVSVLNAMIFIFSIIFVGISIQIKEIKPGWMVVLLVLNIFSILYLLLNMVLFTGKFI